jgi:hypothetical protein
MTDNQMQVHQEQITPFLRPNLPQGANAGAVAIEQERAIAEAQGQLILAKRFPRDLNAAYAELMSACKSKAFAEAAFYSVPNRGTGPSIRFAEEVARCYGNVEYGHRELSRSSGKSEVEVYAWDKEKNNYSRRQITVMHVIDTKQGPKACRDQADIDNKIANVASKQMRGRILALMPKWLVEEAIVACKNTIAGLNDEPIEARVRKMTQAFAKYGVTTEHLERYLGHGLADTLLDELVELTGVFNALKEGAKPSDYFEPSSDAAAIGSKVLDDLNRQAANDNNPSGAVAALNSLAAAQNAGAGGSPVEQVTDEQPKPDPKPDPKPAAGRRQRRAPAAEAAAPEVTEEPQQTETKTQTTQPADQGGDLF